MRHESAAIDNNNDDNDDDVLYIILVHTSSINKQLVSFFFIKTLQIRMFDIKWKKYSANEWKYYT